MRKDKNWLLEKIRKSVDDLHSMKQVATTLNLPTGDLGDAERSLMDSFDVITAMR